VAKSPPSKDAAEQAKQRLLKDRTVPPPDFDSALSTGSTLINMACTGCPTAGYVRGTYSYLVGDSNSGKTWEALTALAEAANRPEYDAYRLILDNVEMGVQTNLAVHFGRKLNDRLTPPCTFQGRPWHSESIEDFYLNLDAAVRQAPCVYVLDSMDALTSSDEEKKFKELKKSKKKGAESGEEQEVKGSYGDGKAKKNSAFLRQMLGPIERSGSILIVISQTRDNIDRFSFDKRTRSGGRAPSFYAQVEVWSSIRNKLHKEVRGSKRHIGNVCEFHVRRSRFVGHEAKVLVPIYYSAGIDDVGSCIDYLIAERHWAKAEKGSSIDAPEFEFKGNRERLVRKVEEEGRERDLRAIVAQVWMEVEDEAGVERKRKYE
jgi:hypothetical protein